MIKVLVILVAFLRLQYVMSSSNQTLLFGYTRGIDIGTKYKHTLHNLLTTFSSQATNTGFYNSTSFSQSLNNNLYGFYMCRGDIDRELCRVCVKYARQNILATRSYGKEGTVWYNHCMLRYSNKPIFGQLDLNNMVSTCGIDNNITSNPTQFMRILRNTMNYLAVQAANGHNGKKFATKVVKLTEDEFLYALVQCTPDLTVDDCRKCLVTSINQVRKMGTKKSGSVLRLNCMVRFEMFPFFYSGTIKPVQSPAQAAINSTEIKLRVRLDILALYNNSTNSSTSSLPSPVEANSPMKILFRVEVGNSTVKSKLYSFPSMVVSNSTVVKQNGSEIGAKSE